jgi:hypothetical protein
MTEGQINPEKITRPIQLLATWLCGLILVDSIFLTAASQIKAPAWLAVILVVASVLNIDGVQVSDFVLPSWFDPAVPTGTAVDFRQQLKAPLEVGRDCYANVFHSHPTAGRPPGVKKSLAFARHRATRHGYEKQNQETKANEV